jgi:hypothetical protein
MNSLMILALLAAFVGIAVSQCPTNGGTGTSALLTLNNIPFGFKDLIFYFALKRKQFFADPRDRQCVFWFRIGFLLNFHSIVPCPSFASFDILSISCMFLSFTFSIMDCFEKVCAMSEFLITDFK